MGRGGIGIVGMERVDMGIRDLRIRRVQGRWGVMLRVIPFTERGDSLGYAMGRVSKVVLLFCLKWVYQY